MTATSTAPAANTGDDDMKKTKKKAEKVSAKKTAAPKEPAPAKGGKATKKAAAPKGAKGGSHVATKDAPFREGSLGASIYDRLKDGKVHETAKVLAGLSSDDPSRLLGDIRAKGKKTGFFELVRLEGGEKIQLKFS